jgi:drug/metabolite transporter (DMT)-like permease
VPAAAAGITLGGIVDDLRSNPVVFILGLFCGVAWALFSNLGRKIAGTSDVNPVPLLFLASSAAFAAAWLLGAERLSPEALGAARWSAPSIAAFVYRALLVDLAAYTFWDAAMRRGSQLLVAAASLFTPLLSTAAIALVVGVAPGPLFWAACVVAIGGAALCRLSVLDRKA